MLLSSLRRNALKPKSMLGVRYVSAEEIAKYKTDTTLLAQWLDVSIVSKKGRAFDADTQLIVKSKADVFPMANVINLDGQTIAIPNSIDAKAKLVVVSFKHYGFSLLRTWLDPFIAKYNTSTGTAAIHTGDEITDISVSGATAKALSNPGGAMAYEICFVKYGFLSMAKSMFISNIKNTVDPTQLNRTGMIFGAVKDFAAPLLLPNVYTGYAFLLDSNNKIRWKGSGQATEEEVVALLRCTDELLAEKF